MKNKFSIFTFVLALSFNVACDEVSQVNPDGQNGDIIWVGNGMRLESSHGLLVDIQDADFGSRSLLVTQSQFLPVVRDVEKNQDVPVRFDWGAKTNMSPIVQLERLDQKAECSRFLSIDGQLVCNPALDSLPIKESTVPQGLKDASLLYVDLFGSLHHYQDETKDVLLATDIDTYFVDFDSSTVFSRNLLSQIWSCMALSAEACEQDLSQWLHLSQLKGGQIIAINAQGAYSLNKTSDGWSSQLLKNFPMDWKYLGPGESQDSLRFADSSNNEFWLRLTETGFENLELQNKTPEVLSLQSVREYSLSSSTQQGQTDFQLCRSYETETAETISKCASLQRNDAYSFQEVLLHYPENLSRPQLIAISKLENANFSTDALYLISIFEVGLGENLNPYLVQLSERPLGSQVSSLRYFDLRPQVVEN